MMAGVCSRGLRLRMVARNRFSVTLTTTIAAGHSHTIQTQIYHFSAYWPDPPVVGTSVEVECRILQRGAGASFFPIFPVSLFQIFAQWAMSRRMDQDQDQLGLRLRSPRRQTAKTTSLVFALWSRPGPSTTPHSPSLCWPFLGGIMHLNDQSKRSKLDEKFIDTLQISQRHLENSIKSLKL